MADVERWESAVRRFLKKSSTQTRAATLRGLRAMVAKPDPAAATEEARRRGLIK